MRIGAHAICNTVTINWTINWIFNWIFNWTFNWIFNWIFNFFFVQGFNGDYLFRSSSKDDQVVLAVNDNGNAVDYPVTWLPSTKSWSFVEREFESLRVRQL